MTISAFSLVAEYCNDQSSRVTAKPRYDVATHSLCLGDVSVKRFRQSAPNQQLVLLAFEEQGWPGVIDDPIPHRFGTCPRERVANAIRRLNRSQLGDIVIRFGLADGGESIYWCIRNRMAKDLVPDPRGPRRI